jgi:hypothetical protein
MADPLELARRHQGQALRELAEELRRSGAWSAQQALDHACAWLLAGDPCHADDLVLEADRLEPAFALVPDPWGLWPAPGLAAGREAEAAQARERLEQFRRWRQADPQALWQALLPRLQADWAAAIAPEACGDDLLILGALTAAEGLRPLVPSLEETLVRLVDDAAIAAQPAAACRFWQLVAAIRPGWDLAQVRAADLSLARGELEACGRWLADSPAAALANPWFHDVAARHALQQGAVDRALDHWAEALQAAAAGADGGQALQDVFEQRRREARRGPGVLQVRSLANRGDAGPARALLERLLREDPQWQPLLSLREQLRVPVAAPGPVTVPAAASPEAATAPPSELDGFVQLLDRATARLQALGVPLQPAAVVESASDAEARASALEAFARRLSDYEARFALA